MDGLGVQASLASPGEHAGSPCHWLWAPELYSAHSRELEWEQQHVCVHAGAIRQQAQPPQPTCRHGPGSVLCGVNPVFPSELLGHISRALSSDYPSAWRRLNCQVLFLPCSLTHQSLLSALLPTTARRTLVVSSHKTGGNQKLTPHQEKIGVPYTRGTAI